LLFQCDHAQQGLGLALSSGWRTSSLFNFRSALVGLAAEDDDADPLVDLVSFGGELGAVDTELLAHPLVDDRDPHIGGPDQFDRLVLAVGVGDALGDPVWSHSARVRVFLTMPTSSAARRACARRCR
jgi:hypothetical protein